MTVSVRHDPLRPAVNLLIRSPPLLPLLLLHCLSSLTPSVVQALDNGFTVPPMGWSSWYGNVWNIDEQLIKETADALVNSGLRDLGYRTVWIDDGFAVDRERLSGKIVVDPKLFPSGMRALSDYVHESGLLFGVYTSRGEKTCMGYSGRHGPDTRPGACGFEDIDADTYANDWRIDLLKNDGCGQCSQHDPKDPHAVMRDALNRTGRPIYYAVHNSYGQPHDDLGNDWRTGIDLCCPWYDLWLHLLEKATTEEQRAKVGPGSFANPDFLQVGWSRTKSKNRPDFPQMSLLERRSHYTMWAALPGPLMMGAELRPGKEWGGIYDPYTFETLTNPEVIAINQDSLAAPMRPVLNDTRRGVQVWLKPLMPVVPTATGGGLFGMGGGSKAAGAAESFAVVLFHRTTIDVTGPPQNNWHTPRPDPPSKQVISVNWSDLGYPSCAAFEVRDLWAKETLGVYCGTFGMEIEEREARIYRFTRVGAREAQAAQALAVGGRSHLLQCGCPDEEEEEESRILAPNSGGSGGGSSSGWMPSANSLARGAGILVAVLGAAVLLQSKMNDGRGNNLGRYLPVMTEEEGRRE